MGGNGLDTVAWAGGWRCGRGHEAGRGLALRVFTLCVYGLFVGGGFIIEVSKGERLFDGLSALRSSRDSEAVV